MARHRSRWGLGEIEDAVRALSEQHRAELLLWLAVNQPDATAHGIEVLASGSLRQETQRNRQTHAKREQRKRQRARRAGSG